MALYLTLKSIFLLNNSLRLMYVVYYVEQTIEEQKIEFDF